MMSLWPSVSAEEKLARVDVRFSGTLEIVAQMAGYVYLRIPSNTTRIQRYLRLMTIPLL